MFDLNDEIPEEKLRHCIKLGLTYHLIKDKLKNGDINEL
jgi:hypothetical protein